MSVKDFFHGMKLYVHKRVYEFKENEKADMSNLTGIATAVVALVVIAAIGVYIADQIYSIANVSSSSAFYTASAQIPGIMNTSFQMLLIAVIALIAGLIIAYLLGAFGGGEQ
jgi:hypothetical protein